MPARDDIDRISQAQSRLAARSDGAAHAEAGAIWTPFLALTTTPAWQKDKTRSAVLSNLVALVLYGEAEDIVTLDSLIRSIGAERTAAIQGELDELLGLGPDLPITTAALRLLGDVAQLRERLARTGLSAAKVSAIVTRTHHQTFWLLLAGAEDLPRTPTIRTTDQLMDLIHHGNARRWRAALLPLIDSPWGPYGTHILRLVKEAELDVIAEVLEECRKVYRHRQEQRERDAIAREIRRLVAISGLTQRQFASLIGTSPSRLSTYVNGRVIPSAAMLLRIRRVAHAQRQSG
ncbi:helix-turn-helix domain-containing protein [Nocardioides bizhenqiangii]|uniref:Helix-turn-helix transcriptional regulator n=1 Tax=Nocardioides bizhenqiangii TaxID=3095076 RepID=A0ABZ0ZXD9_9ACTN|nr:MULTISPECIES: helix-turn-helix transcriptional regulator [unclassified Nocardioides]MDZ5622469.1 helix-turn-helix transcriptional regulator [Nocardioides sp. HM23]WQQ28371.1 helix-turn-helix transcriptional regulator [Nocardioides sp. HM61]